MKEPKRTILSLLFFFVLIFVIPEIDATYIIPRIKQLDLESKIQCHDFPKNCWIKEGPKDERMAIQ
jgi:hypothetical protein